MCGLAGASGRNIDWKSLQALGCFNAERGTDSCGIGWFEEERNKFQLIRSVDHPFIAFTRTFIADLRRSAQAGEVILHTRWASVGAVTPKNAHPFVSGSVMFAHNGCISNYKDFGDYSVDSKALIHGIRAKDFSKYIGSIALLWIEGGHLHAYRDHNPLHLGKKDGTLYFSSTAKPLDEIGCNEVSQLKAGVIYKFKLGVLIETEEVSTATVRTPTYYTATGSVRMVEPKDK